LKSKIEFVIGYEEINEVAIVQRFFKNNGIIEPLINWIKLREILNPTGYALSGYKRLFNEISNFYL
jgi:hypothetical protein